MLTSDKIDTPLGPLLAIADDKHLLLLEFVERRGLERKMERLRGCLGASIIPGLASPIESIRQELERYFAGHLKIFHTPIRPIGSAFQKQVWESLLHIPYAQTRSYSQQATLMGRPSAHRAVANANGANQLALVIPCHRIVHANGNLGGYAGGVHRKEWLIQHEQAYGSQISA